MNQPNASSIPIFTSPWQSRLRGMVIIILAVILFILDGARLTNLWPCDIACQGGAHYQTVTGISIIWFALLSHAGLIALAWRDVRRGAWCPWYIRYVWFLAGISTFFSWVAWQLSLVCIYCIIVHATTAVILLLSYPFPRSVRWWQVVSWFITGLLLMNAVFHHTVVADVTETKTPITTPLSPDGMEKRLAADRGRSYGKSTAPKTIAIIIDLTCRHCAELYEPAMDALQPAIEDGTVRVVIYHLVRPSQVASLPATELAFAAAAVGQHKIALSLLLGTNPDATASGLTNRLADVLEIDKLSSLLTTYHADISAVIADDQQYIKQLALGPRTPSAALIIDGRVTQRWGGDLPVPSILNAVKQP